jgi:hypothetical protein
MIKSRFLNGRKFSNDAASPTKALSVKNMLKNDF